MTECFNGIVKNTLLLILMFAFSTLAMGQFSKNEIHGAWKVQQIVKKSTKPEFRGLLDGFGKATFTFHKNGDFKLNTESKAPTFQIILKMTQDAKWIFDAEGQFIKIGREADGYSIMGIRPLKNGSVVQFAMDESEMVFEVEKQTTPQQDGG